MFKYQEVSLQIRRQIEEGIYKKGDRLPSIRDMIQQYDCNKDTIGKEWVLCFEKSSTRSEYNKNWVTKSNAISD